MPGRKYKALRARVRNEYVQGIVSENRNEQGKKKWKIEMGKRTCRKRSEHLSVDEWRRMFEKHPQTTRLSTARLRLRAIHPVLRSVRDLEVLLLSRARRRRRAASCLKPIHCVDASLRQLRHSRIKEVEPLHSALALGALAGRRGRGLVALLRDHGQRVRRRLCLVKREGGRLLGKEVVAQPLVVALSHEVHIQLPGAEGGEGEGEA